MVVVVLLIVCLVRMSHVSIFFNVNIIMIMMLFVVSSIFTFVVYYMGNDVSNEGFKLLKVLFLGLMVLILVTYGVVIFIGWEGIGVMSMCLIGY